MNLSKDMTRVAVALGAFALLAGTAGAQNGWRQNMDRFAIDRTENGRGTVHVGGKDFAVTSLRVNLQRGGKATLTATKSGQDVTMTGRWNMNSVQGNTVGITIDRVSYKRGDSDRADARGRIQLRGNGRFQQVDIGGRNMTDRNDVRLTFRTRGAVGWQRDDWNDNRGRNDDWNDEDRDQGSNDRDVAGRYTDYEHWGRNGDSFQITYTLDLSEGSHRARLVADSKDRNMPNDATDRERHGDILDYLHTDQNVVQTGTWRRDGNKITLELDRIEYGRTSRTKRETLVGDLRGTSIYITTWDRQFYGRDVRLTFERS